jgi:hypothetical protein
MADTTNSRDTRGRPIFNWLTINGGDAWPARLIQLATGMNHVATLAPVSGVYLVPERAVSASPSRLAWMIRNANSLAPQDGRQWKVLRRRVENRKAVQRALALLEAGKTDGIPRSLVLEGTTHADCLIECERAFIWIEGKRFDWLSPSTTWDVARDQLARNLEAVASLASSFSRDYCLLICHEYPLKHHEIALVNGYRAGTWAGGWPHLPEDQRREFATRIGTVTWGTIATEWPSLRTLPELHDLERERSRAD